MLVDTTARWPAKWSRLRWANAHMRVLLGDPFGDGLPQYAWAVSNCPSFVGWSSIDVADVSINHDLIAEYEFSSDDDAAWFKLVWDNV